MELKVRHEAHHTTERGMQFTCSIEPSEDGELIQKMLVNHQGQGVFLEDEYREFVEMWTEMAKLMPAKKKVKKEEEVAVPVE